MFKNITKEKITTLIGIVLMALLGFNIITVDQKQAIETGAGLASSEWGQTNLVASISQVVQVLAGLVLLFAKDPKWKKTPTDTTGTQK